MCKNIFHQRKTFSFYKILTQKILKKIKKNLKFQTFDYFFQVNFFSLKSIFCVFLKIHLYFCLKYFSELLQLVQHFYQNLNSKFF